LGQEIGRRQNYDLNSQKWLIFANEFRRALELNPGYATAHHWYAWHLGLLGRYDEAIAEMRKAENLDPLSLIINADLAELLVLAHTTEPQDDRDGS
jgi:tetratricopeptide (TPR) repeat protein